MRIVLPNGADVLGLYTRNTIENLRGGFAPKTVLPSMFRLARLVTGELGPLRVITTERT
jgi:hypothetical protein